MLKTACHILVLFFCLHALVQCRSTPAKSSMQYGVVSANIITDSLSAHLPDYKDDFNAWKSVYTDCLHDSLFSDAFYLGLQSNLWIGSISSLVVQNINKQITVLDTSANGNILDILAVNKSNNFF
jgi:hypothetical protein